MTTLEVWHDEIVRWRRAQTTILAALTFCLLGAGIRHAAATGSDSDPAKAAAAPSASDPSTLYASVDGSPIGPARPPGFLGLSLEYSALEAYTGTDPAAPDPVFVRLLRNLAPGTGQPVDIRIGGDSTDTTWWPVKGMSPPRDIRYALTPTWLSDVRTLSTAVPAQLILGVNLASGRPRVAEAEAQEFLRKIGARHIAALEVGNEPDVYSVFPWYTSRRVHEFARSVGYNLPAFIGQLTRWQATLPDLPVAGPALAELPWLSGLPSLLASDRRLRVVTIHRYALQGCSHNPRSPVYPSVANLLSDRSSEGMTDAIAPFVVAAHAAGVQFRVDELNSAALAGCLGRVGVSNTFASALWMVDTLFDLASVGVDGVNVHSLPGAGYELFTFRRTTTGWRAFVHPDYYGMLMFAQAFPAGARLEPVREPAGPVKVWATLGLDGRTRVTLINEDSHASRVELQLPPSIAPAELEWLRAPSESTTGGVTLGGRSFGAETGTGVLGAQQAQPVAQLFGSYSIEMPPGSAALLTR